MGFVIICSKSSCELCCLVATKQYGFVSIFYITSYSPVDETFPTFNRSFPEKSTTHVTTKLLFAINWLVANFFCKFITQILFIKVRPHKRAWCYKL